MAGMMDIGTGYKDRALSGFVRETANKKLLDSGNAILEGQEAQDDQSMVASGAAAISAGVLLADLFGRKQK